MYGDCTGDYHRENRMIRINPAYQSLQAELADTERLITRGKLIHRGRNELYMVETAGLRLCIKRFGMKNRFKSFLYRYLRSPKGLRAWQNAHILREDGFDSPEPVAYIQNNTPWGIESSYYICLFQDGKTLYQWGDKTEDDIQQEIIALARFTARLHNAGLMMRDYTPGNILWTGKDFTLVDVNRMYQGEISLSRGLQNMAGLWLQPQNAALLAREYAAARDSDPEEAEILIRQYRRHFWRRFARRHHLGNTIVHHDLDGKQYPFDLTETLR